MRHAVRIQPYLSRELEKKLRAYTTARSLTVSAVVADALGQYLERDEVEEALLVRRLEGVTHAVEQVGRDLEALAVGFGRFVQYALWSAPDQVDDKVVRRAQGLYRTFLDRVAEQLRAGTTFSAQVFPRRRSPAVPAAQADQGMGNRDEGGRS